MPSFLFSPRGRTSFYQLLLNQTWILCQPSFACHSFAILIPNSVPNPISIFIFNHNLIASIIGSDLKGMNIKAKNPS